MAVGIREYTERVGVGAGEPVLDVDNGEELMHVQPAVSIALGNRPPESPGTLYISTKKIVWFTDADRAKGYAVDFMSLSLHAVSRDPEAYPSPCIYTQELDSRKTIGSVEMCSELYLLKDHTPLRRKLKLQMVSFLKIETGDEDDESEDLDSECNGTLDLSKITEMRLIPSDASQLDHLFEIFCECAELNSEPIEEEEEEHNWIFSADQLGDEVAEGEDPEWNMSQSPTSTIGQSNGDHDLARTVLALQINDQRFEDAEEMEHDVDSGRH